MLAFGGQSTTGAIVSKFVRAGAATCLAFAVIAGTDAFAGNAQIDRGKYLANIIGCSDCHTPGGFSPKPDLKRFLAGSDGSIDVPGLGLFVPPNLTPDKATGLGNWTPAQIATAITTGVRPDGRILSIAMPWQDFSHLTPDDAKAIAIYLKSLPPVKNKVAGPSAEIDKPSTFVEAVLPGRANPIAPKAQAPRVK
jgi:mono/diheme cytochrome c family protein